MILSAENPLTVQFDGNSEQCRVFVSVDGEQALEFKPGEIATIRKSALRLSLINLGGRNIYDSISKKLMKPIK
jgi:NAD kinase